MRHKGRLTDWNDERGFGFIVPMQGGERVFVHISAFASRDRRPSERDLLTFTLKTDARGRPEASDVRFSGAAPAPATPPVRMPVGRNLTIAVAALTIVAAGAISGRLPAVLLPLYVTASAAAFVAYWADKSAARRGAWRTKETTLHMLGIVGGWPGALVAMAVFRHKSRKSSFLRIFWTTTTLNCALFVWLATASGTRTLASLLNS